MLVDKKFLYELELILIYLNVRIFVILDNIIDFNF